jgi:hypothetical protein
MFFDKEMFWMCLVCAVLAGLASTFGVLDAKELTSLDKKGLIVAGWLVGGIAFAAISFSMKNSGEDYEVFLEEERVRKEAEAKAKDNNLPILIPA